MSASPDSYLEIKARSYVAQFCEEALQDLIFDGILLQRKMIICGGNLKCSKCKEKQLKKNHNRFWLTEDQRERKALDV